MRNDNAEKTVIAQSEEHLNLLHGGWKPSYAYQSFSHTEKHHPTKGYFQGHDLKPKSELMVIMARREK